MANYRLQFADCSLPVVAAHWGEMGER